MSITGELKQNGEQFEGYIADLLFDADIALRPNQRKDNDAQPDFLVFAKSPRGRDIPVGAAWGFNTSQAGNQFLSLTVSIGSVDTRVNAVGQADNVSHLRIIPFASNG